MNAIHSFNLQLINSYLRLHFCCRRNVIVHFRTSLIYTRIYFAFTLQRNPIRFCQAKFLQYHDGFFLLIILCRKLKFCLRLIVHVMKFQFYLIFCYNLEYRKYVFNEVDYFSQMSRFEKFLKLIEIINSKKFRHRR